MRLVFFGTSPRSAKFLELATQNGLKFDLVVSEPPKPTGRQQVLTENPTVTMAKILQIPHFENMEDLLKDESLTLGLILDFQKIIPDEIINKFTKGIINTHFSKLPIGRGPAPVQYTILNGDKEAWISYYLINSQLDAGPIVKQTSLTLDFTETTDSLYLKLIEKAAQEAPKIIKDYLEGKITPQPQTETPTFAKKLKTENCRIDWSKSPEETERLIRAAYSEPGAYTIVNLKLKKEKVNKRLKILKAHLEDIRDNSSAAQREILSKSEEKHALPIRLNSDETNKVQKRLVIVIDQVQLEGKKPVTWQQFKEGYPQVKLENSHHLGN